MFMILWHMPFTLTTILPQCMDLRMRSYLAVRTLMLYRIRIMQVILCQIKNPQTQIFLEATFTLNLIDLQFLDGRYHVV